MPSPARCEASHGQQNLDSPDLSNTKTVEKNSILE